MNAEMLTFIDTLFRRVPPGDHITLSAIDPDGERPSPSRHVRAHDRSGLLDALSRADAGNRDGWGIAVGGATRSGDLGRWHRGGYADLAHLPALFIDVDENADLPTLVQFIPAPSIIVGSGYGLHAYWLLRTPTDKFARASAIMRGLSARLGGDGQVTVAHSMRVPGTLNTKHGHARPCRLLQLKPDRIYTLRNFSAFEAKPKDPPRRISTSGENADLPFLIAEILIRHYRGYRKANGWIAALCPCGHRHDTPGQHFNYSPALRMGHCFGRHGRMLMRDLCCALEIQT
jgi:hypothetical protein